MPDYFTQNPVPDLKPDIILAALDRPITGDKAAASYVRWQLLSGLPETIDLKRSPRAIDTYRRAPLPNPRFGIQKSEQVKLDQLLTTARRQDDVVINAKVEEEVKKTTESNVYVLGYRNEFYRRLPKTPSVLIAGMQDADERLKAASGAKEWTLALVDDVNAYLASEEVDAKECRRLADAVGELKFRAAPTYYEKVSVSAKAGGKLAWEKRSDTANPDNKLPALQLACIKAADSAAASKSPPKSPPGLGKSTGANAK